jgi:NodT family efflux transporter outer membrane factor (OMF) lipoprotein
MLTIAGCSFAPPYRPPSTEIPAAYKEAGPWTVATPGAKQASDWWKAFGDDTLDTLEGRIEGANPTLAGALARYDQARGYLGETQSAALPQVGLETDFSRNRQSDHRPLRSANQPNNFSSGTVEGEFGYELDLWGRVRNSIAAGKAQVTATGDDLAAIRLSLEAQLAAQYVALRGYDREEALLRATVDAYSQADALTQRRFQGGIASAIDTGIAGTQLAEARAQLADVAAARALSEHAIASLVGTPASNFTIAPAQVNLTLPSIPLAVPSTLLQGRPDVAAAERRMAAANSEIGVVKAAFFPAITLGGGIGFQNTGLSGLVAAPNTLWSIGATSVLSIFDGGLRRSKLAVARASWTEQTASYRGLVLQAFQDVEDNLALLHHLSDEATQETEAETQAGQVEKLYLNRYVKGAVNYLDVVTAQTTALRTRLTALDLETRRLQASVQLIRAMGGGWSTGQAVTDVGPRGATPQGHPAAQ